MAESLNTEKNSGIILLNYFPELTMDFFSLRNRAVKQIQEMASEQWTDYNEHDPGVTIVEQLCYAITDLSYRTSFPIQDLLAEKPKYNGKGKDSFVLAPEILPCHAETINDWRKLFIDKITEVENIWLEPVPVSKEIPGLLYNISIQKKDSVKTGVNVLEDVKKLFYENRNLGEDIGRISILDEYKVKIKAEISIDGKESTEEVLASIFYSLYRELSPKVLRYTFSQLRKKGYPIEDIFNTPSFENGFILDEDLFPKTTIINSADLINAVRSVSGVETVNSFEVEDAKNELKILNIEPGQVAVLDTNFANQKILLKYNKEQVAVNMKLVVQLFNQKLFAENDWLIALENKTEINQLKVPAGKDRQVAYYRSVQFTFPSVYGLGNNISSPFEDKQAANMELQLKGYLALFDQFLTNYLAQLSSLAKLFSIDPEINRTYFTRVPDNVPQLDILVGNIRESWNNDWKKEYAHALREIMSDSDNFNERRNLFLDHLLSRFGVDMDEIAPEILNWYKLPENEYDRFIIGLKCISLRRIADFTRNRSMAANLLRPDSISIFEQIVMIQLGIASSESQIRTTYSSLADPVFNSYISPTNTPDQHWDKTIPNQQDSILQKRRSSYPGSPVEKAVSRYKKIVEMLKDGKLFISVDMLAGGFTGENYFVEPKGDKFTIIYRSDPDPFDKISVNPHAAIEVGTFDSAELAENLIVDISVFVRNLNLRCEGFHLVEHILLRDSKPEKHFYVEFMDHHKKVLLISMDAVVMQEREKLAKEIVDAGRNHFSVNVNYDYKTEKWSFYLIGKKNCPVVRSFYQYSHRHELNHALRELEVYFNFTGPEDQFIKTHCRYTDNSPDIKIPDSFFSFRMTAVFPSWPSRFRNDFYKSRIRTFIRAMAPAQLGIYLIYLDPKDMRFFENLYTKWRTGLAENPFSEPTKNLAYQLTVFLLEKDVELI